MQAVLRAGMGVPRALPDQRRRELFNGVPGKFGHVREGHERGLLAAPEFGYLAINEKGSKLHVELFGGQIAIHGPCLWDGAAEPDTVAVRSYHV